MNPSFNLNLQKIAQLSLELDAEAATITANGESCIDLQQTGGYYTSRTNYSQRGSMATNFNPRNSLNENQFNYKSYKKGVHVVNSQ